MKKNSHSEGKKPTIFDVARVAGVSRGTVDRVVFCRGRVSAATREKVQEAISRLGYTADPNASKLASRRPRRFVCLIPHSAPEQYWAEVETGFTRAAREMAGNGISVDILHYDQNDPVSFNGCTRQILESHPDGVVTNVVFRDETARFTGEMDRAGIPYAFVDNKLDDTQAVCYYGADPRRSGELGAFLLTGGQEVPEVAMIRLERDHAGHADPNGPRRKGFLDYLDRHSPGCVIHSVFITPDHPEKTYARLGAFFAEHPGVRHLAMANSRVFLLSDWLRDHPDPARHVVGFDDLKPNLDALREGLVEFLVTRRIAQQGYLTLTTLAEAVRSGRRPAQVLHYMHMDILHRMNLDDYSE